MYPFYRWEQWSKERLSSCFKSHMSDSRDLNPLWFRPRPLGSTQCLSAPLPKESYLWAQTDTMWFIRLVFIRPTIIFIEHMLHLGHWAVGIMHQWLDQGPIPTEGPHWGPMGKSHYFAYWLRKKKLGTTSLSREGRFNKLWYIHIMKYSVAIKKC